jgi:hypothetical protein
VQQIRGEIRSEVKRIRTEEGVDLEAWWVLGEEKGSDRLEAKTGSRGVEKL